MRLSILALAGLLSATTATADNARFELTPIAGWQVGGQFDETVGDTERDLDEAAAFGMILNLEHGATTQWELYLSRQRTEFDANPAIVGASDFELDVDYYHIGGNVAFDGPIGRPYVAATVGATRLSPSDSAFDSTTRFSAALGGGVRFPVNDRFSTRVELRALGTVMDNDTELFCLSDADGGACAVAFDGSVFWQVVANAGFTVRFD